MIERAVCSTLIGREDELSILEDALIETARGEGRPVVLAGEAGLGKTRLALELRRQAAKLGVRTLWGSCSESDLSLPYLPFLEAIGNQLAGADVDEVLTRLGKRSRDLSQLFPQLGNDAPPGSQGDPAQAKLRLFEAILGLLRILADNRPLLVVVEDLHWADSSTRELLDYLVRRVRSVAVMILVTTRLRELDRTHPVQTTLQRWRRSQLADIVELSPLTPEQVAGMVCAIFDQRTITPDFRDYLHRRSEGNPFILEEMLKEALDRGDIFPLNTGWDRRAIAELRIPETVRETLLLRLDRLEPEHVEVLRSASVIGASFDFTTLVDVCGIDEDRADAILQDCIRQQFLEEDQDERTGFRFRHSLTCEAIYQDMTAHRRARTHGRVADVLGKLDAPKEEQAHHLVGANRVAEAVPLWIAAADEAVRRHAYLGAAEMYERALPHIADPLTRARALGTVGEALRCAGPRHYRAAVQHLEASVAALTALGDDHEVAKQRVVLAHCHYDMDDRQAARAQYQAAREYLERFGATEDLAVVFVRLSALDYHESPGEWESAATLARRAIETASSAHADAPRIWAYNALGSAIAEGGQTAEGLALLDRSYREAVEHDLDLIAGNALNNKAGLLFELCRPKESLIVLDKMRALPDGFFAQKAPGWGGYIRIYLGELESGVDLLRAYLDGGIFPGLNQRTTRMLLAWGLLELGRVDDARAYELPPNLDAPRYELVYETIIHSRYQIALATAERALPAVDRVLGCFDGRLPPSRLTVATELPDAVIAVLLASGERERAARVAAEVTARGLTGSPWGKRAHARVLLSEGRSDTGQAVLAEAAAEFADAGFRLAEVETRLLLADSQAEAGGVEAAAAEIRAALAEARTCGAIRLMEAARGRLRTLGFDDHILGDEKRASERKQETRSPTSRIGGALTERGEVSVLHAKVRPFTGIGDDSAAQERTQRIAKLQRWAQREVQRHDGVAAESLSEALSATFNAGADGVDPCLHAVQTAVALCDKAALLDLPLSVGVSVPEGDMYLSATAAATTTDATSALATRLAAAAQTGETAVSREAYGRVKDWLARSGIASSPSVFTQKGHQRPLAAHLLRRSAGRATSVEAEEQLAWASTAWREGRSEESGAAAARARDLGEAIGDAALVTRAVAAQRRTGAIAGGIDNRVGHGHGLSRREFEVTALVAEGMTNAEIGRRLHISDRTAATHVGNILTKLDLRGRAQIARWAAEQRLLVEEHLA